MEISRLTFQVLSGLLAFIPIAIGLRALSSNKILAGVFVFFLAVGIVTDVSMGMIVRAGNIPLATKIFQYYSLFEALTFLWFVYQLTDVSLIKKAVRYAALTMPVAWCACVFILPIFADGNRGSAIFDSSYEVLTAFLAGFAILALTEKNENLTGRPYFWLLLAIFFYCFGTFFVMIFVKTLLSQRIWFINNIVNVITYGLYGIGLWRLSRSDLKGA